MHNLRRQVSPGPFLSKGIGRLFFALLGITSGPALGDEAATRSPTPSVLRLQNGGVLPGALTDSPDGATLRWQAAPFVAPFDFPIDEVQSVQYTLEGEPPKPVGDYCFEMGGGDVLFGNLVDLDEQQVVLESPRAGLLHVERRVIQRIDRWRDRNGLIYSGPNGTSGWSEILPAGSWREDAGHLLSENEGATIRGDLGLPGKAAVELELSWKSKPDFVLAFGVNGDPKSLLRAFRFEVWEGDLVVVRETEKEADMASVQQVAPGPGRVRLQLFLDQEKGRILVFAPDGKPLADITVADLKSQMLPGVQITNKRGDVRLERLRIGPWNGESPRAASPEKARIHNGDGSILYGQVAKYDGPKKEFVVRTDSGETRVAEDKITALFLSPPAEEPARVCRAVFQDGSRIGGDLSRVEKGEWCLKRTGVKEPLSLPQAGLRSFVVVSRNAKPAQAGDERLGRLEVDDVRMQGRLVDGRNSGNGSCLVWRPLGSSSASPLRRNTSGRILYKDPAPTPVVAVPRNVVRMVVGQVRAEENVTEPAPTNSQSGGGRSLHLRTGDVIPSEIVKIDEQGVTFKSALTENTFVPHAKIKAVELAKESAPSIRLSKVKRERLLTLPRMQKDSPPLHLIRSKEGDYLRGRVVAMNEKTIQVEVRLETKEVPRDRVSRIIWLHPDELESTKGQAKEETPQEGTRVQVLRSDGIRLTFLAEQLSKETLLGTSDVVGTCRVQLKEVDQLLIGNAIEKEASQLAYQQWKLQHAPEPKDDPTGGDASGRPAGTESPLVGKLAPDFTLKLLDGRPFTLSQGHGKVYVLDFWATWCGPCLQAMPVVERVTDEFREKGVELIAVNLQESAKQVTALLERQKLKVTVALDLEGGVAHLYGAYAIPQTVIIDAQGKVTHLFVGGGPHLEDQLRNALKSALGEAVPTEPVPKP
ncbi:TlpA family protein disulfide reductase [Singulisphaera rosea]